MTKSEYISKLKTFLKYYPSDVRQDVLEDFEDHFEVSQAQGLCEEEIIQELGSIEELKENIIEQYGKPQTKDERIESIEQGFKDLASLVQDTVNDAMSNLQSAFNLEPDNNQVSIHIVENAQSCDSLIIQAENSNTDIYLQKGKELSYSLQASKNIFAKEDLLLNTYIQNQKVYFNLEQEDIESFGMRSYELRIVVPEQIRQIEIVSHAGDITCAYVNLESFKIEQMNGDVELNGMEIGSCVICTKSGDISMQEVNGTMDLQTVSGDIDVYKHIQGKLRASSVSGDIDIEHYGDEPVVLAKTVSGDIDCHVENANFTGAAKTISGDFEGKLPVTIYKKNKGYYLFSTGEGLVNLETVSGDIYIKEG